MTKALTLTQPWATLVALGVKKVETRSWRSSYRGPLLIHAAKGWDRGDMRFAVELHERGVLAVRPRGLPRGAIVARAALINVVPVEAYVYAGLPPAAYDRWPLTRQEVELGNFDDGRFAWLIDDVVALAEPLPWRGALGLWDGPDL